jgi:myosin heavy subunit
MFDWLVNQINAALAKLAANLGQGKIIYTGVLDIYGFEIFQVINFSI